MHLCICINSPASRAQGALDFRIIIEMYVYILICICLYMCIHAPASHAQDALDFRICTHVYMYDIYVNMYIYVREYMYI